MFAILDKIEGKLKLPFDIWFFFLFLLSFSLTVRKVLFYFPIQGTFNEYTGIYVYISDIFLIFTICLWFLSILSHDNNPLSRCKRWINWDIHALSTVLPAFLILLSFISIFWSVNKDIALFRSIKLLEYYLLYLFVIYRFFLYSNVPRGTFDPLENSPTNRDNTHPWKAFQTFWQESVLSNFGHKCSTWNIFFLIFIFGGVFQSIVAIIQFITQKSLGLRLLQESILAPNLPGVAKIILNSEPYIRAYGLMPHPNILGGFLLFTIIVTILYYKMFHVEHFKNALTENVPRGTFNLTINFLIRRYLFNTKWLIKALIAIQLAALLLTFSKSAILGFIIVVLYIFWKSKYSRSNSSTPDKDILKSHSTSIPLSQNVPRGTLEMFTGWNIPNNSKTKNADTPPTHPALKQDDFSPWKAFQTFWQESVLNRFDRKCSTWNTLKFFLDSHLNRTRILLGLILAIVVYFIFRQLNFYYFITQPINERLFILNVPRGTFWHTWIIGSGIGQFVPSLLLSGQNLLLPWQYQPIHNVYLLLYAELGIIGLALFLWFLWHTFNDEAKNVPRGTFDPLENSPTNRDNTHPWKAFQTFWQESVLSNFGHKCSTPAPLIRNVPRGTFRIVAGWNILHSLGLRKISREAIPSGKFAKKLKCHSDSMKQDDQAQNDDNKTGDSYNILCNNIIYLSRIYFKAILLGFLFIMLLDHYFWDIQQGSLMLWLVLGLIVGLNGKSYNFVGEYKK